MILKYYGCSYRECLFSYGLWTGALVRFFPEYWIVTVKDVVIN